MKECKCPMEEINSKINELIGLQKQTISKLEWVTMNMMTKLEWISIQVGKEQIEKNKKDVPSL